MKLIQFLIQWDIRWPKKWLFEAEVSFSLHRCLPLIYEQTFSVYHQPFPVLAFTLLPVTYEVKKLFNSVISVYPGSRMSTLCYIPSCMRKKKLTFLTFYFLNSPSSGRVTQYKPATVLNKVTCFSSMSIMECFMNSYN